MPNRISSLLVIFLLAGAVPREALAADVRLGLQVRPRLEKSFAGNLRAEPGGENYRVTQRTRATIDTELDVAKIRVSIQDIRTWASELGTLSDFSADNIDLHEAWAEVGPDWLKLRVGRQEIALNEQRLIGAPDFAQQNRSFDAVRVTLTRADLGTIDLVVSRLQDGGLLHDLFVLNPAIVFTGPFGKIDLRAPLHFQTNAMVAKQDRGSNRTEWSRFTGGVYIMGEHDAIQWRAEGYGQFGDHPSTNGDQIAFMFGARLGYEFNDWLCPVLWVDYLSGDSNHIDTQAEAFDTLYPAGHGYYGLMDRFMNIPSHTGNGGLVDLALKNKGEIGPGTLVSDLHLFLFAQENEAGQEGPLGVEVDLVYGLPIVERVKAEIGFSLFFDTGDFMAKRNPVTRAWIPKGKIVHDYIHLTLDVMI